MCQAKEQSIVGQN